MSRALISEAAMRLRRFAQGVMALRRHRVPLTGHNLRAIWRQADPDWQAKLPVLDMSDAEWDEWMRSLQEPPAPEVVEGEGMRR